MVFSSEELTSASFAHFLGNSPSRAAPNSLVGKDVRGWVQKKVGKGRFWEGGEGEKAVVGEEGRDIPVFYSNEPHLNQVILTLVQFFGQQVHLTGG